MYEMLAFDQVDKLKKSNVKNFNKFRLSLMKKQKVTIEDIRKECAKLHKTMSHDIDLMLVALLIYLAESEKKIADINQKSFIAKEKEKYNGTLGYVFANEVERKRDRYFEKTASVVLDNPDDDMHGLNSQDYLDAQKRYSTQWNRMTEEFMVDVERDAVIDAWIRDGIEEVVWIVKEDNRVCEECKALDKKIFPISAIPPRPHYGCRCEIKPHKI